MCKASSTTSCLPQAFRDYEKDARPLLIILRSKKSSRGAKTQASETLGSKAAVAYNANRHGKSYSASKGEHVEFNGCGVFDLVMPQSGGIVEVKEAKGGKSGYGTRRGLGGKKRVTQCTPGYNRVIAHKMKHSNYKGRHSTQPCTAHSTPVGSCSACKRAEARHRRLWGSKIEGAMSRKGKFIKISIRGDYTKTCLREPKAIEGYTTDSLGAKFKIKV